MILQDMVSFICGKVNQTDADDLAACKGFLTQQHEILWTSQLWKDALISYTQTLSPNASDYTPSSSYLPTKGVLLLPSIIERVLAVRSDSRKLNIRRPEFYYRVDYDSFIKTGAAADYLLLPACAWEFDSAYGLYVNRGAASDDALKVNVDLLDSDGISVTRSQVTMDAAARALTTSERVDAVLKKASNGTITITPNYVFVTNNFPAATLPSLMFRWAPGEFTEFGPSDAGTIVASGATAVLTRQNAWLHMGEPNWGAIGLAALAIAEGFYGSVNVVLGDTALSSSAYTPPISLATADTAAKARQRIRLVNIPDQSMTIRVLGKRRVPSFSDDLDEPALNGFVQPLLCLGQAEMLERERQYSKAAEKKKEAIFLLQELVAVETVQQAHNQQIIPESGYGDDDSFGSGGFSF